jgi:hypothetical protein
MADSKYGRLYTEDDVAGASLMHLMSVERAYDTMMEFVARHPERVKVPDFQPRP